MRFGSLAYNLLTGAMLLIVAFAHFVMDSRLVGWVVIALWAGYSWIYVRD